MNNFAHNGIVHTTSAEASAHVLTDVAKLLLITLALILVTWMTYKLYRNLSFVVVNAKNRRGSK